MPRLPPPTLGVRYFPAMGAGPLSGTLRRKYRTSGGGVGSLTGATAAAAAVDERVATMAVNRSENFIVYTGAREKVGKYGWIDGWMGY